MLLGHNEPVHKFPELKNKKSLLIASSVSRLQLDRREYHRSLEQKKLQRSSGLADES